MVMDNWQQVVMQPGYCVLVGLATTQYKRLASLFSSF
jgi:hypothetical protein